MALINGIVVTDTDGDGFIDGTSVGEIINAGVADSGIVIRGLDGDDTMTATAGSLDVTLDGGAGVDALQSSIGAVNTTMDGGPGWDDLLGFGTNDTASYANDPAGVTVNLSNGQATDGYGDTDYLFRIENVTGSDHDDTLTGDVNANVLQGGGGKDTLTGGLGADVFKYSFDLKQGGSETSSFTEFFKEHGGTVDEGGEVADGTKQGQFSSLYTQWLESLGLKVLDLGQNSGPDGTPIVDGPDGTFGERESFTWTSGSAKHPVDHERWYSDTFSTGDGQDAVTSGDGFDTIVDFTWGVDQLEFNGLAGLSIDQFASFFDVTEADKNSDGITDTVLSLADGTWEVTLLNVSGPGHLEADFYGSSILS